MSISTVAPSTRTFGILGALLISGGLIIGAFVLSANKGAGTVNAGPSEELLAAYAEKDTDADGVPDWKEALYGTDPANPRSWRSDLLDGEAVAAGLVTPRFATEPMTAEEALAAIPGEPAAPGSLTDRFAREFLERYLTESGGQPLDAEAEAALVSELIAELAREAHGFLESAYGAEAVRSDAGVTATAYGIAAETLLLHGLPAARDGGDIIALSQALVERGDESAGPAIQAYAAAYRETAAAFMTLAVPPALADAHLALARSLDSVGIAAEAVARYEEDPVVALQALGVFVPAREEILAAMKEAGDALRAEGIPAAGAPGATLSEFARTYAP